jgi:hypothetical protein
VHLDRPYALVREGSIDDFLWTTIVLYLEQRYILFYCLFSLFSTPFPRFQRCLIYLAIGSSLVIGRNLCRDLPTRTDVQYLRINRKVKVFRDRWQFELKIVRHIIPDPGAFKEALKGSLLILSDWYRLCCRKGTPRSSWGIWWLLLIKVDEHSVISLGLRVVNLRSGV